MGEKKINSLGVVYAGRIIFPIATETTLLVSQAHVRRCKEYPAVSDWFTVKLSETVWCCLKRLY